MKRLWNAVGLALVACVLTVLVGCGQSSSQTQPDPAPAEQVQTSAPADGTYDIEVATDSSMFRSEKCVLTVKDGVLSAELTLPGEGFSKLYFGTAEDAKDAPKEQVFEYHLNEEGKYTFDVPVAKLDEELPIAAFGQRRDTWYDHTITFHAPQ